MHLYMKGVSFLVHCSEKRKEGGRGRDETYWKEIHAAMALTNMAAQGKDGGTAATGTTSCIIQKSSHIAEIKTVKVPLVPQH